MPKTFEMLSNWQNFAKSGRTASEPKFCRKSSKKWPKKVSQILEKSIVVIMIIMREDFLVTGKKVGSKVGDGATSTIM